MDNSVDRSDWRCFLVAVGALCNFDWSGDTLGGRMVVPFPLLLPTGELIFQFNPSFIPGLDRSTVFPAHIIIPISVCTTGSICTTSSLS